MPFDIDGARKEGYSDAEIVDHLSRQEKFDAKSARAEGYPDADILTHLTDRQRKREPSAGELDRASKPAVAKLGRSFTSPTAPAPVQKPMGPPEPTGEPPEAAPTPEEIARASKPARMTRTKTGQVQIEGEQIPMGPPAADAKETAPISETIKSVPARVALGGGQSIADTRRFGANAEMQPLDSKIETLTALRDSIAARAHEPYTPPDEEPMRRDVSGNEASTRRALFGTPRGTPFAKPQFEGAGSHAGELAALDTEIARISAERDRLGEESEIFAKGIKKATPKNEGTVGKMIGSAAESAAPTLAAFALGGATSIPRMLAKGAKAASGLVTTIGAGGGALAQAGGAHTQILKHGDEADQTLAKLDQEQESGDPVQYIRSLAIGDPDRESPFGRAAHDASAKFDAINQRRADGLIGDRAAQQMKDRAILGFRRTTEQIAESATAGNAKWGGVIQGIMEGVGEKLALGVALKPGTALLKRIGNYLMAEGGQEFATQGMQTLDNYLRYDPTITLKDALEDMLMAAGSGIVTAGAMGPAAHGIAIAGGAVERSRENARQKAQEATAVDAAARAALNPTNAQMERTGAPVAHPTATSVPARPVPGTPGDLASVMADERPLKVQRGEAVQQGGASMAPTVQAGAEVAAEQHHVEQQAADLAAQSEAGGEATMGDGTPTSPVIAEHAGAIEQAVTRIDENRTREQILAGNDRRAHIETVHGLHIAIENAKGAERVDMNNDPPRWRVTMPAHYGYIKKTEGADGEKVDVYLGDSPQNNHVLIVDQIDPTTGKFDEHKVMMGFTSPKQALEAYKAAFNDGSGGRRVGATTIMGIEKFKEWLKGDTTKAVKYDEAAAIAARQPKKPEAPPAPPPLPPADNLHPERKEVQMREFHADEPAIVTAIRHAIRSHRTWVEAHELQRMTLGNVGDAALLKQLTVLLGTSGASGAPGYESRPGKFYVGSAYGNKPVSAKAAGAAIRHLFQPAGGQDAIPTVPEGKQQAPVEQPETRPAAGGKESGTPVREEGGSTNAPTSGSGKPGTAVTTADGAAPNAEPAGDRPGGNVPVQREEGPTVSEGVPATEVDSLDPNGEEGWTQIGSITGRDGSYFPIELRDVKQVGDRVNVATRQIRIFDENSVSHLGTWQWQSRSLNDEIFEGLKIDMASFYSVLSDRTENAFGEAAGDGDALWAEYGGDIMDMVADHRKVENKPAPPDRPALPPPGPKASDAGAIGADEFAGLIDEVVAETRPPAQQPTESSGLRTTADRPTLGAAAGHAGAAVKEGLAGLDALFGGKGRLGSGPSFDEETWKQAKPHFDAAYREAVAAGKSLKDFIRSILERYRENAAAIIPYLKRWHAEQQGGTDVLVQKPSDTSGPALEGEPAADVQAPTGAGAAEGGTLSGGTPDAEGNGPTGAGGNEPAGGVGPGEADAHPPAGGTAAGGTAGQPGVRGDGGKKPGTQQSGGTGVAPGSPHPVAGNFVITDEIELGKGGPVAKYNDNVAAIKLLKQIEVEGRMATPDEQKILARYVGWGGIKQVFPNPGQKAPAGWEARAAEIRDLLTPEEHEAAASSIQAAHYTSREVVDGIWAIARRLGFDGGHVSELSMGIGNFFGLMPLDLRAGSKLTGIERDNITARIAKQLYPKANVIGPIGTQDVKLADGIFNLNVGNPPFGEEHLFFPDSKHLNAHSIHNQFFMHAIDKLAPGGLHIQVVSRYLMDAKSEAARAYIAHRAELVGAIRLPWTAFYENARTQVITDIIILQKLPESKWGTADTGWIKTGTIADPLGGEPMPVSQYFIDHPDMILGTMDRSGSQQHQNDINVRPTQGIPLGIQIIKAAMNLPQNIYTRGKSDETVQGEQAAAAAPAETAEQYGIGNYFSEGTKLFQRVATADGSIGSIEITEKTPWGEKSPWGAERIKRLRGMIQIRNAARGLLAAEANDAPAAELTAMRKKLNRVYDKFVAEHGYLNDNANRQVFRDDPIDAPLLLGLEIDYDRGVSAAQAKRLGIEPRKPSAKKMTLFTERTIYRYARPTKADNPADGLEISIAEKGGVNIPYIADLTSKTEQEVIDALTKGDKPAIYFDPGSNEYVIASEYLSGNVKRKHKEARDAGLIEQAEKLVAVFPPDKKAAGIRARMGANWIDEAAYVEFAKHLFGESAEGIVRRVAATGGFLVQILGGDRVLLNTRWGTPDRNGADLFNRIMNNRDLTVRRRDANGDSYVDLEATQAAKDKADEIRVEFEDWIFNETERRERLVAYFNEHMNTNVETVYDGDYLKLPGKVPDVVIKLRRSQKNAIARIIRRGKVLLDHVVGAGKTYTVIAAIMEQRRMGLVRKPMLVVPNHLVLEWATQFYRLYPGAKILTMKKSDFSKENRQRMLARVATGDWDAVIFAHSSFGFIANDRAIVVEFINAQIAEIQAAIDAAKELEGKKSRTAAQYQKMKDKLTARLADLMNKPRDQVMTFQQLGVDSVYVDESHEFKNLFFTTQRRNVGGFGNPAGSKKAFDLYMKTAWLQRANNGKGVVFATGTPISNSLTEMYTLQRYLGADELKSRGLTSLDAWLAAYGTVESEYESNVTGTKYKRKERLRGIVNASTLMPLYKDFQDAVTNDDIKRNYREENNGAEFPLPKVASEPKPRENVAVEASPAQIAFSATLQARMENLAKTMPEDNALAILGDGRKAALDIRLVLPHAESGADPEYGKVNVARDSIVKIYHENALRRGTQLVFLDLSTPLKHGMADIKRFLADARKLLASPNAAPLGGYVEQWRALRQMLFDRMQTMEEGDTNEQSIDAIERFLADDAEIEAAATTADSRFSVYDDLREKLIAAGIPASEIAFIHDHNGDVKKQELFDQVNAGRIRVLMGSTAKMGAGMNVQKKLVALHHLDCPWRPSDIEQREGRIIRFGNEFRMADPNFTVTIKAYATKATSDVFFWQTQEQKLNGIYSLRKYEGQDEIEEVNADTMSAAEMKALASGNPLILEDVQLTESVRKLEAQRRRHAATQQELDSEAKKYERWIETLPGQLEGQRATLKKVNDYRDDPFAGVERPTADVDGKPMNATEAQEHLEQVNEGANKDIGAQKQPLVDRQVALQEEATKLMEQGSVAPANQARYDEMKAQYAEIQKEIDGIKGKWSITFDGKEYTGLSTMHDAIVERLGDVRPIRMTVDGETLIRRSDIRNAIDKQLAGLKQDAETIEGAVTFGGLSVNFTNVRNFQAGTARKLGTGVEVDIGDASRFVEEYDARHSGQAPVTIKVTGERVLNAIIHLIESEIPGNVGENERHLKQAQDGIEQVRQQLGKPWNKDLELDAKKARLANVRRTLAGDLKKDESAAVARVTATETDVRNALTDEEIDAIGGDDGIAGVIRNFAEWDRHGRPRDIAEQQLDAYDAIVRYQREGNGGGPSALLAPGRPEAKQSFVGMSVAEIRNYLRQEHPIVHARFAFDTSGAVQLMTLESTTKRQGHATRFMYDFTQWLDDNGYSSSAFASPSDDMPIEKLIAFNEAHGYISGDEQPFRDARLMYRVPQAQQNESTNQSEGSRRGAAEVRAEVVQAEATTATGTGAGRTAGRGPLPSPTPGVGHTVTGAPVHVSTGPSPALPTTKRGALRGQLNRPAAGVAAAAGPVPDVDRVRAIIDRVLDILALPRRQGRMRIRGALGTYDPGTGAIRQKVMDDFEVFQHEVGHAISQRHRPWLKRMQRQHRNELRALSYQPVALGKQMEEGFAEFMRLYVTNRPYALRSAPKFGPAFDLELRTKDPELAAALDDAERAYAAWLQAPSQSVVKASVIKPPNDGGTIARFISTAREDGFGAAVTDMSRDAYTAFVDDKFPIKMAVEALRDLRSAKEGARFDLKAIEDAYKLARLSVDAYSSGHMDIMFGVRAFGDVNPGGPGLSEALGDALGKDAKQWSEKALQEFEAYLVSRRAVHEWDRYHAGDLPNPPTKESKADHEQNIVELDAAHPEWDAAAQKIYAFATDLWTKKRDAGLITEEQYRAGIDNHTDYVPFRRDVEEKTNVREAVPGTGVTGAQSVIKGFQGSMRDIVSPVRTLMQDAYSTAATIARNEAVKALANLARRAGPGGANIAEEIPNTQVELTKVPIIEALESLERQMNPRDWQTVQQAIDLLDNLDLPEGRIYRRGEISEKGEPIVYWWADGKRHALRLADHEFGLDLYQALTGLGREQSNLIINVLAAPAAALRIGVTVDPSFFLANILRDQISAWVLAPHGYTPFVDAAKGLYGDLTRDDMWRIYNSFGGIMGGANVAALDRRRMVQDFRDVRNKGINVQRFASWRALAEISEISETGTRIGIFRHAYQAAIARGASEREAATEAAFDARDYLDFGRHGSRMLMARRTFTFLNAALQAMDKGARVLGGQGNVRRALEVYFKHANAMPLSAQEKAELAHSAKAWGKVAIVAGVALLVAIMNRDDKEYEEFSPYLRATHILVHLGDHWYAYPKPYELAFLANITETTFEAMYHNDPARMGQLGERLSTIMLPPLNSPGVTVPFEVWANKRLFDNREIVPERVKGREPYLQFTHATSRLGKMLGKAMNVSPEVVDHVIKGFAGTLGKSALWASNIGDKNSAESGPEDMWVVSRFVKEAHRGSQSALEFWKQMTQDAQSFQRSDATFTALASEGADQAAKRYLDSLPPEKQAYVVLKRAAALTGNAAYGQNHPLARAQTAIRVEQRLRDEISESAEFSPREKRRIDDALGDRVMIEARNALISAGMKGWTKREYMDLSANDAKLEAASPKAAELLRDRLAIAHVVPWDQVKEGFSELQKEALGDMKAAVLDAVGEGRTSNKRGPEKLKRATPLPAR